MTEDQVSDTDKPFAAGSYNVWLIAAFVLFSETKNNRPFQRYHVIQALGFAVVA